MSTIKIQTQSPTIPIEVGSLKLEFDMTDENIKRLYDTEKELQKQLNLIEDDDFDGNKKGVKKVVDYILGEGSFDKLYELSSSTMITVEYFTQICAGLKEEIYKRTGQSQQDKVQKYLQKKGNHNKNHNRNQNKNKK